MEEGCKLTRTSSRARHPHYHKLDYKHELRGYTTENEHADPTTMKMQSSRNADRLFSHYIGNWVGDGGSCVKLSHANSFQKNARSMLTYANASQTLNAMGIGSFSISNQYPMLPILTNRNDLI